MVLSYMISYIPSASLGGCVLAESGMPDMDTCGHLASKYSATFENALAFDANRSPYGGKLKIGCDDPTMILLSSSSYSFRYYYNKLRCTDGDAYMECDGQDFMTFGLGSNQGIPYYGYCATG